MNFLSPFFLILLTLIPLLFFLQKRQQPGHIRFSTVKGLKGHVPASVRIRRYLGLLTYLIIALVALASARPQLSVGGGKVPSEGIDIAMIIDVSGSMKTLDKIPQSSQGEGIIVSSSFMDAENRLTKVKRVSRQFVKTRKDDRVGLIAFAGKNVLASPLTQDYKLLDRQIASLDFNLTTDGTALGMAIISGVNMLKDSERKEKSIIILTDGINNAGDIEPVQAAYVAKNYNVKIYPIEMGSFAENEMLREQSNWEGAEPKLLDKIAQFTGGKHFSIPDSAQLYAVYNEIEKAEKSKIDVTGYVEYVEIYPQLVIAAVLLLIMQIILLNTRYRKIP